jgi:hypothetical protein
MCRCEYLSTCCLALLILELITPAVFPLLLEALLVVDFTQKLVTEDAHLGHI